MAELDDDLDLGVEETDNDVAEVETPAPLAGDMGSLPDWAQKEIANARREAQQSRVKLRRTELAKEYGDDVLELVPEVLPVKEQKELAAKVSERLRTVPQAPTEVETPEAPSVERQETEARLAAVSTGPSGSASSGALSDDDALALAKTDPERYAKLRDQGVISLPKLPGHL